MSRPNAFEGPTPSECVAGRSTRDAEVTAFVAALRLAATPSVDDRAHASKVLNLQRYVAASARARCRHVAALFEAALAADVRERVRIGLPPREDQLFRGWLDPPTAGAAPRVGDGEDLDGHGAFGAADDVDLALQRSIALVRGLRSVPRDSDQAWRMWDDMEATAFAPCHGTPASTGGGEDRRRVLLLLWLALRRRRPLAAAVLRRCLALDRRFRRGAPDAT